ncbi:hypothetical protein B0H67DRAFT_559311 [Lasiosphaeris hirsuta]|uniref:Ankyrin repeat protein n=1 Tax=Lasiosphaeris hirsuta TaxID=260670 RepID=A0AA40B8J9_9PEZI|nr:hypothetical protein B0H67DRAFT_559311 [Lasiosphaeris hirsuta]
MQKYCCPASSLPKIIFQGCSSQLPTGSATRTTDAEALLRTNNNQKRAMEQLPYVPASILWEMLSSRSLAALAGTSRSLHCDVEPFLYRRHAVTPSHSAIMWAVETAQSDRAETQTTALATLDKVKQFCRLAPGALDVCYRTSRTQECIGDFRDRFARVSDRGFSWASLSWFTPLAPLHVASWKGLDAIVEWLLGGGADANVLGTATPLCLAVSSDRATSALLLLAHGASPDVPQHDALTVLHLTCAMGYADLAEQLLVAGSVRADATDVLCYYNRYAQKDVPAIVKLLARHGANSSDTLISEFLTSSKWRSASALLRSKNCQNQMSPSLASDLLDCACSVIRRSTRNTQDAKQIISQLLDMGADPNTGQLLWTSSPPNFPVLLTLLPHFLEAGMDPTAQDLLGETSAFDRSQDKEGVSAQLAVVRLLLQYGAPIGPATRGDALDALMNKRADERGEWAYKLCGVLLEHCRQTPRNQRHKDMTAFLGRLSPLNKQLGARGFDVDSL